MSKSVPVALEGAAIVAEAVRGLEQAVLALRPVERPVNASPARRARAAWLFQVPGAAQEFQKRVPADHLEDDGGTVRCVCGSRTAIRMGDLADCAGDCGRVFLRTDGSVRVAKWDPVPLEDRYAGEGWTPAWAC